MTAGTALGFATGNERFRPYGTYGLLDFSFRKILYTKRKVLCRTHQGRRPALATSTKRCTRIKRGYQVKNTARRPRSAAQNAAKQRLHTAQQKQRTLCFCKENGASAAKRAAFRHAITISNSLSSKGVSP
jgi:hypothetical protein